MFNDECSNLHWIQCDSELGGILRLVSGQRLVGRGVVLRF